MSIVDLVLSPTASWVLTDSAISDVPAGVMASGVTSDPAEAARSAFASRPAGPPARSLGEVNKVCLLPRARLAVTGSGHGWMQWWFHAELMLADPGGIMEVVDAAPARLRSLARAFPAGGAEVAVYNAVLAGWCDRRGRAVAYALCSGDGFRPVELPDGTALCPTVSTDDPAYAELYRLSTLAGEGREAAERFLLAAARNQVGAYERGLFGGGIALGGTLRLAEVTARGVDVRVVGEG